MVFCWLQQATSVEKKLRNDSTLIVIINSNAVVRHCCSVYVDWPVALRTFPVYVTLFLVEHSALSTADDVQAGY